MAIPFAYKLNKIVSSFEDLKVDDRCLVYCVPCKKQLLSVRSRYECRKHIDSKAHKINKGDLPNVDAIYSEFLYDFCFMVCACSLPWNLLENKEFKKFWNKYIPHWKLPSSSYMRIKYLPRIYANIMQNIRGDIQDNYVWVSVNETMDFLGHKVVNVFLKTLNTNVSGSPFLIASKRVEQTTASVIEETVCAALRNVGVEAKNVLMFVTDDAVYMHEVAVGLKRTYSNMTYVTCVAHALHRVAEEIGEQYSVVDQLIWKTKEIFVKAGSRKAEFCKCLPNTPLPPQPVRTRWCTWLEAVEYYAKYFHDVKQFVMDLNPEESKAIHLSQKMFQKPCTYSDLCSIRDRFHILISAIKQLENPAIPLAETIRIISEVQNNLNNFSDAKGVAVKQKLDSVLKQNSGYTFMCNIASDTPNTPSLEIDKKYFRMAQLTSVDVERSTSLYEHMYRPNRSNLTATNAERILVVCHYAHILTNLPCTL